MVDGDGSALGELDGVADHVAFVVLDVFHAGHVVVVLEGVHDGLQGADVGIDLGDGVLQAGHVALQVSHVILQSGDILVVLVQPAQDLLVVTGTQHQGCSCENQ